MELKSNHALLITFYWPPSSGPGVHRWLRFSKYFKENQWDLTVYIPEGPNYTLVDEELTQKVPKEVKIISGKYFDPTKFISKKSNPAIAGGFTHKKKASFFQKLIIKIRGNFFVPDARVFWVKPSIRRLRKYLTEHPEINTLISTGPPHSLHLIALKLKKEFPKLYWIADFRDPWTEIDFYKELQIGKRADQKHKRLELEVLKTAEKVISVSQACCDGLAQISNRPVELVTNGFEFEDFDTSKIELDVAFTLSHFGSLSTSRNPENLWKALGELKSENPDFAAKLKIKLVGTVDVSIIDKINENGLSDNLELIPYVKYAESISLQRSTQVLLLIANNSGNVKGILTGKVFEYLGAKRPIFAIGQEGSDLMDLIKETKSGVFCDFDEITKMKSDLNELFKMFNDKKLKSKSENLGLYSSSSIVGKLLESIDLRN